MPSDAEGGASKSPGNGVQRAAVQELDDLVSVTVRKNEPNQKAGISLVERQGAVYVTKVTENGLFHGTDVEIGDLVLSVNGKRLGKGEGARDIIKHIGNAKSKVTMVIKKSKRKGRRGSRSVSPRSYRKKRGSSRVYEKVPHRNADGSLKIDEDPRIENFRPKSDDGRDQIPIKAKKVFPNQDIGVTFKDIDNMVFVSGITLDSIFQDTELTLGDRIVSVNDMNFMTYADAGYAKRLVQKAKTDVTLVIEKGHTNFNVKIDVDDEHGMLTDATKASLKQAVTSGHTKRPSVVPKDDLDGDDSCDDSDDALRQILAKAVSSDERNRDKRAGKPIRISKHSRSKKSKKSRSSSITDETSSEESPLSNHGSKASRSSKGTVATSKSKADADASESSLDDELEQSGTSSHHRTRMHVPTKTANSSISSSSRFSSLSESLRWEDYDGDYMKVTVRKQSMEESGISLVKIDGKFILTALPEHERRISVGMEVLAINGVGNLHTVLIADELIRRSPVVVVLNIAFNEPVENTWKCPCCGKPMNAAGCHSGERSVPLKSSPANRGRTSGRNDELSTVGSFVDSISDSISTTVVNNQAPASQRLPKPVPEGHQLYNYSDYESDSDTDALDSGKPPRPSISRYGANDRFMVRVSKKSRLKWPGITFFDYKGIIYISDVAEDGPFFATAINRGDKILSINGRKMNVIKNANDAMRFIEEKRAVNIFALRSDPESDGYKEAISHFPT